VLIDFRLSRQCESTQ